MNSAPVSSKPVSIARGAALAITMRWTDRLIAIVSTLILARILAPADFGIVAMASLVVALVDALLDLGVNTALIQNRAADGDDFNAAWTLRLAQCLLIAGLVGLVLPPLAAVYFNDPRVEAVLRVMAVTVLVGGFENIGIVALQKNMEFGREFRFLFYRRLVGFVATIAFAYWLRSYWAMVLGALAGRTAGVGLSYVLHEFRPRLCTHRLGTIWTFSQWMLVRNLGAYGVQQVDKLVVGRRDGAAMLGAYGLADDISAMPVSELLAPIGRVLLPAYVQVADRPRELRRAFTLALGVQTLLALPAGVGLATVADLAVPLLLGPQWGASIHLLQLLALVNVATTLTHSGTYLLLALGKVRVQALFACLQFVVLAAFLTVAFPSSSAEDVARIRLVVTVGAVFAFLAVVLRTVPVLRFADIAASCWRPILAVAGMALVLHLLPKLPTTALTVQLIVAILVGAAVYPAILLLLWQLSGRPDGPERFLLTKLRLARAGQVRETAPAAVRAQASTVRGDLAIAAAGTTADLSAPAGKLLESNGRRNHELGPLWFENLQKTVYAHDTGVHLYEASRHGECIAVVPLRMTARGRVRVVESLANYYSSLWSPAMADSMTSYEMATLLRRATTDSKTPHEMRLAPMDPEASTFELMESALRSIGWVPFRYYCFGNWCLHVHTGWRDYLASRPGEVKSTVKRMSRRFAAAGGTLELATSVQEIETAIGAYTEVYASSWKKPEPFPDFVPGLIRNLAAAGDVRLGVARIRGKPVAAQIWAVRSGRAAIIKLAHHGDYAAFSPGTLLTARLMEHVLDVDHATEVDYLVGDDAYKQNWMNLRRERWGIVAYNPRTVIGLLLLMREAAMRLAKAMARSVGLLDKRKLPKSTGRRNSAKSRQ